MGTIPEISIPLRMTGKRIVGKHGTKKFRQKKTPRRYSPAGRFEPKLDYGQHGRIEQTFEVKLVGIPIANIGDDKVQ